MVGENAVGSKFISLLVDDEESKYLSTPISIRRLASFINGHTDLRNIFVNPEISDYYTFNYTAEDVVATLISVEDVLSDYLPEAGFYLKNKAEDTTIIQEAIEKNNAIVHIAFSDNKDSNSIDADQLGDLLKSYQLTIENTFKKRISQVGPQYKAFYSSPSNYKLRAFASSPGSFNVHLFSTAHIDMFGNSLIGDALRKFDELLQNNLTDDELLRLLRSVKGHTISSLRNLLQKVISLDIKIKHKWYAPDQSEVHVAYIDRHKAENITNILNSAEELAEELKEFTGFFEQVDIDKGTWRILNSEDKKPYSGTSQISLQGTVVGENVIYRLICNEIIEEMKVTEKEKTKLILISIELVNPPNQ